MITSKSRKREIKDLQRLLLAVGAMELSSEAEDGKWGSATQAGVVVAYTRLGWDHPDDGRWISAPALAALASAMHHTIDGSDGGAGAGGSNIGAGGSNIGAGGSNIGAGGSNIGGSGSHIGGSGSHIGGSGSHIGGSGSHIGSDGTPD